MTSSTYLIEPGGTIVFTKYGAIPPDELHHTRENMFAE
jgi:hypothetical protein